MDKTKTLHILYLSYWNLDDPLTIATVLPHLKLLTELENVASVTLITTQRYKESHKQQHKLKEMGVTHSPIYSKSYPINIWNKINDFILFPRLIREIIDQGQFNFIIARGSPAGSLAYLVSRKNNLPFLVESYEPHADYMRDSGVWKGYDPRYLFQRYWECKINRYAKKLITVSMNYKSELLARGVPADKLEVAPCAVDPEMFYFESDKKSFFRKALGIPTSVKVGIYVGKFGGLYYDTEIFVLFKKLIQLFDNKLFLIVLSDMPDNEFKAKCLSYDLDLSVFRKLFVSHNKVNDYLMISDFAIAPYRETKSAQYLSPVKVGEYWAAGLPVILSEGVGDEHKFIEERRLGITLDINSLNNLAYLEKKLIPFKLGLEDFDKQLIRNYALHSRSFQKVKDVYHKALVDEQSI